MLAVSAWMTSQRSTTRLTRAGLLTFLTCCSSQFTQAEDPASLQSRLEQIESQNEQLRQELSELRKRDELLATQISSSRVVAEKQQAARGDDPKAFSA